MDDKRFRRRSAVFPALLLTAILAAAFVLPGSSIKFTGLQNIRSSGDTIYGINLNGTVNELFELSSETGTGRFLKVMQFDKAGSIVFPDLEISDEGEVILLEEKYSGAEDEAALVLVRWNREKNKLETIREVEPKSGDVLVDYMIKDGNYCFLFYTNGAGEGESLNAFALTPQGTYLPMEYNEEDDWDFRVTGVSLSSMPHSGVRLPTATVLIRILKVFLLLLAGEILVWGVWQWWQTRQYRPGLLVRLSAGTAAVLILLMCLFYGMMKSYLYNYVSKNEIYACMVESELFGRMMNRDVLDDLVAGRSNASTAEFSDMLEMGGINSAIAWYDEDGLHIKGDLFCRGIYQSSMTEGSLKDCVDAVCGTETPQGFLYAGRRGLHAMALRPEKTASGLDTVLCVQIPMREFQHSFHEILINVISACQMASLCILLGTGLVLSMCLSPFKRLRNAVSELAAGKLDTRVRVRGHNELASVASEFNLMAEELENTRAGADIFRSFYEAFWPMNLLRKITGKRFNSYLKPGSHTEARAVTLAVKAAGTEKFGEEALQELLAGLIETVRDQEGSVISFRDDRLTAVFPGNAKDALTAAVQIQRIMEEKTGRIGHMGMAYGMVRIYTAGIREHRAMLTEDSGEAWRLCGLAELYGDGLILTDAIVKETEGKGSEFHFRRLGKVAFEEYCPKEELYELLDAETAERSKIRTMGRTRFEAGVSAYSEKNYFMTRNAMISCLDADPEDRAARSYVINCDRKEPPVICQAMR